MTIFDKEAEYYNSVRREVLELVETIEGAVLDVGCGDGSTLAFLKNGLDRAAGIEINPREAEKARVKGLEVYQLNLDTQPLPFAGEEFDFIIVADVLEHLYDPWQVLKKLTGCLKPGGKVLLSIPNVKHYHVMRDLLFKDKWTYCEAGILDRTHIRFFTRCEAISMIEGADLRVEEVVDKLLCSRNKRILNDVLGGALTRFLTYQYLIVASKR